MNSSHIQANDTRTTTESHQSFAEDNVPRQAESSIVHSLGTADRSAIRAMGEAYRSSRGWGQNFVPPHHEEETRLEYRRFCDELVADARGLQEHFASGGNTEDAAGLAAELEAILESLYDCRFGEEDAIKSVVVAIQSQVLNVIWTQEIASFMVDVAAFLRARFTIDAETVDTVNDIIEEHGLDVFRGTVSEPQVRSSSRHVKSEGEPNGRCA